MRLDLRPCGLGHLKRMGYIRLGSRVSSEADVLTHYRLVHCIPDRRLHGLNGYREVIDSMAWGLRELGHEATYSLNAYDLSATNIVFGVQMLPLEILAQMPKNTIVYDMEQMRNIKPQEMWPQLHYAAQNFSIWSFSPENLAAWRSVGATRLQVVPVGYAPVLSRIVKPVDQDIDVLMYGISGAKRLNALHTLSNSGLITVFVSGLYGDARDALIARSKLILNVNLYDHSQIFEIVRVSFLLANKKAVVAIRESSTVVESDFESAIKFTTFDEVAGECLHLVENEEARRALENRGFDVFARRDIRGILGRAIASSQ